MLDKDVSKLRNAYRDARAETDPFEKFNRAQGMGSVRDPYPGMAMLRAAGPVHRIDLGSTPPDVKLPPTLRAQKLTPIDCVGPMESAWIWNSKQDLAMARQRRQKLQHGQR